VVTANDYYPFGMQMPGRSFNATAAVKYRYGFNGKENDNDVKGEGNQQDYGMRIYDPRLGRFLSVDPLIAKYPFYSPYHFAGNSPIIAVDLDGSELLNFTSNLENKVRKEQTELKAIGADHIFSTQLMQAGAGLSILKTIEGAANLVRAQSDPLTAYSIANSLIKKQAQIASDPISQGMITSGPVGALYVLLFKDDAENFVSSVRNSDYVGIGESGTNIAVNAASLYEGIGALKPGAFSPSTFGGKIGMQGAHAEGAFGGNTLGKTFKTFDQFDGATGTAASVKSVDLSLPGATPKSVSSKLKSAMKAIEEFPGYTQKGFTLKPDMIKSKQLKVAFYGMQSGPMKNVINMSQLSAGAKGIEFIMAKFGYKNPFVSAAAGLSTGSNVTSSKKKP
jgi:RHS repeat-associated protein